MRLTKQKGSIFRQLRVLYLCVCVCKSELRFIFKLSLVVWTVNTKAKKNVHLILILVHSILRVLAPYQQAAIQTIAYGSTYAMAVYLRSFFFSLLFVLIYSNNLNLNLFIEISWNFEIKRCKSFFKFLNGKINHHIPSIFIHWFD